ncbi:PAS domain-containing sensor histidine kinase [Sphingomonas koreensis]|nr:PAS domain-containing sensor histidine kinase [Sphingomonas koreensis]
MKGVSPLIDAVVGIVLAILVGGAGWALFAGLRTRFGTRRSHEALGRLAALEAISPAQAMIVYADGRVEMPRAIADWLGLDTPAKFIGEVTAEGAGLTPDDADTLAREITATQRSGRTFNMSVQAQRAEQALVLRGQRAPETAYPPGAVVVWVFDATASQREILRLEGENARLRNAYEALTGLIEVAPLPMWYRGADLRLAMVNSAYVDAVEASGADDVVARGIELVEAAGLGGPLASAVAARDSGAMQQQAMPATIGGARRMLRVFDVPLPTGGVAGFAVDIDELEQARGGIKRFAEAQRAMLDRLSAGVAQFSADRALVFCNQPFRRLFAMRREWLADRPEFDRVLERMREANRLPEVRDFPGWKAERRAWFTAAPGGVEENWHLPGGMHLRLLAQPLPDGGLLLVFEDRTEQVQLASARDTLLRVRTATFDNLFEALGVFAADGRLQLWNTRFARVWNFDDNFLAGHPRVDALAERAATQLSNPARASLIGELVRSATVERQQRGGRVAFADGRHFEFAAVPLPDGNALFTMLDITDNRRIEQALRDRNEALEAADKVKTAFVANMSYELRTPLTSISGFAEMLHGGYAGKMTKAADGYVEAILDSVGRLGTLIDEVLDLTQHGGAPELDLDEVDLAAVAQGAAEAIAPLAERYRLDFAVEILPFVGMVRGDARRLGQVAENLLRHAIADTPEGGRILLHADGTKKRARLIVSDDGPGMDAAAAAVAFDRFARPGMTDTGERALGLGLPLARQIVEAHGGTIALVSEPGQGTLITVELPRG